MTEAEARASLESMLDWASDPALTSAEIARLLLVARRIDADGVAPDTYTVWTASTALTVGALIVPTVRNGHVYKVTVAGTTGTTEPTWPLTSGTTVTNGAVTFQESGAAPWTATWDLNSAAAAGWRLKAGKAAGRYQWSAEGMSYARQQTIDHCLRMAQVYSRGVGQSLRLHTLTSATLPAPEVV